MPAAGRIATVVVAIPGAAASNTVIVACSESMISTVMVAEPPAMAAISLTCSG